MTVTSDQQRTARGSRTTTAGSPSTTSPGGADARSRLRSTARDGGPDAGSKRTVDLGALTLETGGSLPSVQVAYETWGTLNAAGDNAILVEHALTGDSHVAGPAGPGHPTPGLVGRAHRAGPPAGHRPVVRRRAPTCSAGARARPGRRRRPRTAGRGAAGSRSSRSATRSPPRPRSPTPSASTAGPRSSAARWAACGCSSGPSTHPDAGRPALVLASTARTPPPTRSPGASRSCRPSATTRTSTAATTTTRRRTGPHLGLGLARRIAHVTYRSELELDDRFGREAQDGEQPLGGGGRYAVESLPRPPRATSWPAGSTPTPTSCSPRR